MYVYSDANWISNIDDYQCTSNYVFLLNNGTINWSSKKQSCIDLSSIKVKYIVVSQATRQVMSFSSFFGIIGQLQMKSIVIYDNNHHCISLWKNSTFQAYLKYIKIHHHFVQDKIKDGFIKLVYHKIENMVVDILIRHFLLPNTNIFNGWGLICKLTIHWMGVLKMLTFFQVIFILNICASCV
jgi:hypothetical protein